MRIVHRWKRNERWRGRREQKARSSRTGGHHCCRPLHAPVWVFNHSNSRWRPPLLLWHSGRLFILGYVIRTYINMNRPVAFRKRSKNTKKSRNFHSCSILLHSFLWRHTDTWYLLCCIFHWVCLSLLFAWTHVVSLRKNINYLSYISYWNKSGVDNSRLSVGVDVLREFSGF